MKVIVLFTMKGCPHCTDLKELFQNNEVAFIDRDIFEYADEYEEFVSAKKNEFVPAMIFMTLDKSGENYSDVKLLSPDDDYQDITEAFNLANSYVSE